MIRIDGDKSTYCQLGSRSRWFSISESKVDKITKVGNPSESQVRLASIRHCFAVREQNKKEHCLFLGIDVCDNQTLNTDKKVSSPSKEDEHQGESRVKVVDTNE